MAKLVKLDEAAQLLGMSVDDLTEMRSRNEIFGYRDGATWKFKMDELERVARERGVKLGKAGKAPPPAKADDDLLDLGEISFDDDVVGDVLDADESDSILVSEKELGQSDENTASTIIGEADDLIPTGESDIQFSDLDGEGSELRLAGDSNAATEGSEIELEATSSDLFAASDVLEEPAEKGPSASDTANLKLAAASDIGGDELSLEGDDSGSLELSLEDVTEGGSELRLNDDSRASSSGFGSAIDLDLDDDDLVLGSGSGSDVTSGAGDSGINLSQPSDSGLSLEEPLNLDSGAGAESLELGEDDMIELDDAAVMGGDDLQSDDDFLLTPVADGLEDDGDSGSQVIALDSEEFDDSAMDMLTDAAPVLEEEAAEPVDFTAADDTIGAPAGLATSAPVVAAADSEAPYTIWNVLSLFCIVLLLGFTGILMLDLIWNIWSWNNNFAFNSAIMDSILSLFPGSQ